MQLTSALRNERTCFATSVSPGMPLQIHPVSSRYPAERGARKRSRGQDADSTRLIRAAANFLLFFITWLVFRVRQIHQSRQDTAKAYILACAEGGINSAIKLEKRIVHYAWHFLPWCKYLVARANPFLDLFDGLKNSSRQETKDRRAEADNALSRNEHRTSNDIGINLIQCMVLLQYSAAQFLDNPTQWTQCVLASTQLEMIGLSNALNSLRSGKPSR